MIDEICILIITDILSGWCIGIVSEAQFEWLSVTEFQCETGICHQSEKK